MNILNNVKAEKTAVTSITEKNSAQRPKNAWTQLNIARNVKRETGAVILMLEKSVLMNLIFAVTVMIQSFALMRMETNHAALLENIVNLKTRFYVVVKTSTITVSRALNNVVLKNN